MPPPTNTTAADAIALGTLPASISQDVHDAGTTYDVWYYHTATVTGVLGLWGFGDLVTYTPTLEVWTGPDPGSLTAWPPDGPIFAENKPSQFPIVEGETYWFSFTANGGDPTPAILLIEAEAGPDDTSTRDRIVINDDTNGFPAIILDATTGDVIGFTASDFPAGEAGDRLPTGEVLVADAWNGELRLYNSTLSTYETVAYDIAFSPAIRAQRDLNLFYAGRQVNPAEVRAFDEAGDVVATYTLTGNNSILGLAASNDGNIIYHGRSTNQPLRRWDVVGNTNGTNLAAAAGANITAGQDILVLDDDTIIASFVNQSTGNFTVRHYEDAGTLLNTFTIATTSTLPFSTPPRLFYGRTSSSFWAWYHPDGADEGTSRWQEIRVSDGSVIREVNSPEFEIGVYEPAATETPLARFGNSFSCFALFFPGVPLIVDLSEECCPCDCPEEAGPRGSPTSAPLASHAGPILPPIVPEDWTPQCTGGGDVPTAADATDPESWVQ